ncbi:MAG: hypothetical protein M3081_09870 [Gemmatimonadota bacterium]|nr:hypothetical protein [Gemmatimonadota bacterium]
MSDASITPSRSSSRKRKRAVLILLAISIGWKVVVLTLGHAIPQWFIDDGLASAQPDLRPYGAQARETARVLWSGAIERHAVRKIRLVSVARVDGDARAARCGGLNARVRAYTYFAIPYSEVRTVCDSGIVEYRVFRRTPPG